ncbi:hypothetical protein [Agromyces salentinus]|uniref:DUF222 domain-containing protein n=1 Tax=Agromyces salentinus TaxID=269421 RepID=A0ABP4YQG8_9MICO|nr:hypothetical protein [Agromyces salentinus]
MTTCDSPAPTAAAAPLRAVQACAAQACAELVARLPTPDARTRTGHLASAWAVAVAWTRGLRMPQAELMPRAGVPRAARPDPVDAREAVSHYLSMHWVNR